SPRTGSTGPSRASWSGLLPGAPSFRLGGASRTAPRSERTRRRRSAGTTERGRSRRDGRDSRRRVGRRGRSPGPRSHAAGRSAAAVAIAPAIALAPAPGSAPNVDRLNALNLGLMLVSAAVAWVTPFEVLLLSYAVLGPLHYLTEISWLHDRAPRRARARRARRARLPGALRAGGGVARVDRARARPRRRVRVRDDRA